MDVRKEHEKPNASKESKGYRPSRPVLVIHGGAGAMSKSGSTEEQRERYRIALREALKAGYNVLRAGGEAIDAATAAVAFMEDCPLFNSGRGAVFNSAGHNELESSIMLSKAPNSHPSISSTRRGVALTLLTRARNPIKVARSIYLSPSSDTHATLSGSTPEEIGLSLGQELVQPSYFFTKARWREHRGGLGLPELPYPPGTAENPVEEYEPLDLMPKGTVGAVALDERGCLASATSTGGKTNKLPGRIGDTPQFGAGFCAYEWEVKGHARRLWRKIRRKGTTRAVGISGTGDGDYFIRQGTALTIVHRMKYLNESLDNASGSTIKKLLVEGGLGGVIALDNDGNVAMPLNCPGMYRGVIREDGRPHVAIFSDDVLA